MTGRCKRCPCPVCTDGLITVSPVSGPHSESSGVSYPDVPPAPEPPVPPEPGTVSISLTADRTDYAYGDQVVYTIVLTNNTGYDISDSSLRLELTDGLWSISGFEAGGTRTFTSYYDVGADDVFAGSISAEAVYSYDGYESEPSEVSDGCTVFVSGDFGDVSLVMTADKPDGFVLGETVHYDIVLTNNMIVPLYSGRLEFVEGFTGDSWTIDFLAPGDDAHRSASYVVTEADILRGEVTTSVRCTYISDASGERAITSDPCTVYTELSNPSIAYDIATDADVYDVWDRMNYTCTLTNDGNLTVTNIEFSVEVSGDSWTVSSLAPGASESFSSGTTATIAMGEAGEAVFSTYTSNCDSPDPDIPVNVQEGMATVEVVPEA